MPKRPFVVGRIDSQGSVTYSGRPWGNGILDSFRSKLPTPDDHIRDTLVASILEQMAQTHAKLAEDMRRLADTLREDGVA